MIGDVTFTAARATQAEQLGKAIEVIADQLTENFSGPGPIFVGIGASHAAACAPVWTLRSRGIHSWRLPAGDFPLPFPASLHPIVAVSQSGRSAETLAVLESAEKRYAVVNHHPSPIADLATTTTTIGLGNLPDSYASTIGYTATVAALGMLADVWDGGDLHPGWHDLAAIFDETEGLLADDIPAELFTDVPSIDFVGSGPAVGSAEAGALLFREVARIHATAMSTRQYLHGSMESAGAGVHVLLGDTRELTVARTLADTGHQVILISAERVPPAPRLHSVRLPKLPASQRAILEALVMQSLVAGVAELHNIDIEEFVFHNADTKVPASPSSGEMAG
jgi:glucosamine--fructose-6-phosphate aminotransferase (isomerizing)